MESVVSSHTKQPRTEGCAQVHTHNGGLHFFTTDNLYVESLMRFSAGSDGTVTLAKPWRAEITDADVEDRCSYFLIAGTAHSSHRSWWEHCDYEAGHRRRSTGRTLNMYGCIQIRRLSEYPRQVAAGQLPGGSAGAWRGWSGSARQGN